MNLIELNQKYGGFKDRGTLTMADYQKAKKSNSPLVTFYSSPKADNHFSVFLEEVSGSSYTGIHGRTREEAAENWFKSLEKSKES